MTQIEDNGPDHLEDEFDVNFDSYALEERIVFDGAGMETTQDIADSVDTEVSVSSVDSLQDTSAEEALIAALAGQSDTPKEFVFIDTAIDDYETILNGISEHVRIILLDPSADGVTQIADALRDEADVGAIHIISHGRSGTLDLGSAKLTEASMRGRHSDSMTVIADALSQDADILIYGCDFGAYSRGVSAVEALAAATGADVAASEDLTGAAHLGGDWDLEVKKGAIDTAVAVSLAVQNEYQGVLAPLVIDATGVAPSTAFPVPSDVGDTVVRAGAGTIGGAPIDIHATILSADPSVTVFFDTVGDDLDVDLETDGTGGGSASIRWEIFEAGTNNIATGAPSITFSDIDGINAPFTMETVIPEQTGLLSFTTGAATGIFTDTVNGELVASGTDSDDILGTPGGPLRDSAAVTFNWGDRTSWEVTYTVHEPNTLRVYLHDGDGDFTFAGGTNTTSLRWVDHGGHGNGSSRLCWNSGPDVGTISCSLRAEQGCQPQSTTGHRDCFC